MGFIQGKGKKKEVNGTEYKGSFKMNELEGRGTMVYPSGRRLKGSFRRGTLENF